MEEIKENSCSTNSKKCCTKGIIILVICCLVSFFIGYYSGLKSPKKTVYRRPPVNRAFSPNAPQLPNRRPNINRSPAPNISKIQKPPIQQNIQKTNTPTQNPPKVNIPKGVQAKLNEQKNNKTDNK